MRSLHSLYHILLKALGGLLILLMGCKQNRQPRDIDRSFYYWKSSFVLTAPQQKLLESLHVKKLYVKFFDVAWNEQKNQPMPVALVKFRSSAFPLQNIAITPTVFITNECMEKLDTSQIKTLAEKIVFLIKYITSANGLTIHEIQMDCDWNASSRDKYFALLNEIRRFTTAQNISLSATIRLYQCKYADRAGIPPVDRGLLMCYNMGNLKNPLTGNSILDSEELKKYITALSKYPLPLDVALPLFGWKVLFRDNKYKGLISELPTSSITSNQAIKSTGNHYTVLFDTSIEGYDFKAGDFLRDEQVVFNEITEAAGMLDQKLKTQHFTVSLYHLDSLTLSKFSVYELETIFNHFR